MELTSVYKVKEWILNQIKAGKLNNGDKLPSYLSIARDLKVKTDDVYDGVDELITEQILSEANTDDMKILLESVILVDPHKQSYSNNNFSIH